LLSIIRVPLVLFVFVALCTIGFIGCLFRPFHPSAVYWLAQAFSRVSILLGVKLELRGLENIDKNQSYVVIGNHQSTYDIFTISRAVFPGVTSVGKKSLLLYPFFGLMYWLSGNILIDRKNSRKASGTLDVAADAIVNKKRSVWMFPEGTRSRGRGVMPFKLGAFRLAQKAQVPILPVVASQIHNKIAINKWNNGRIIVQIMPPIPLDESKSLTDSAETYRALMAKEYDRLNQEVATLEANSAN
jgi:1-acyl-sn-glycerol-3-phosphate acyltransferase